MRRVDNIPSKTRGGMALVIILGFIAVLSVLAISLIITMRVERLATNSFAETVRARQLIHVALARAMDAIDADMTNRRAFYSADVYAFSTGATSITNVFPTLESRLYVPQGLTSALPASVWLQNVTLGTQTVGRVGYVAVDMSGLLDANVAGRRQRGRGASGDEIQLSPALLAEIRNLDGFLVRRSNEWRRFESIAEMFYLGGASGTLFTNTPIRNFATYSQFGPDLNPRGQPKVSLAGDANALLSRRSDIVAALAACRVPNPERVFTNLLDYVDTDSIPRDLESFTTEAVPMINEVVFSNSVSRQVVAGDTITVHRVYMTVETWFPFGDRSFPASTLVAESSPIVSVLNAVPAELAIDPVTDLLTTGPRPVAAHGPNSFQLTTFVWEKRTNAPIAQNSAIIRLQMNSALRVEQGGNRLDLARFPNSNIDLRTPIPPNTGPIRIQSLSVNDPRLNYLASEWVLQSEQPPTYTAITPGRINQTAAGGEGVSSMYVRDFPLDLEKPGVGLGTVGELGFLSIGQPWRTIALYNAPGTNLHPVLDHFTIGDPPIRRALVNINSPNSNVIASAFFSLPIEAYPGGGGPTVTVAAARALAKNLMDRLSSGNRYETNRALSVIGEFDVNFLAALNGQLASPVLTNDALRESLVRNAAGLFSYRQNLFNVYLFAQSITPGGATGAEARAVATIWRDPELEDSANKTNKMFIRFFRWL